MGKSMSLDTYQAMSQETAIYPKGNFIGHMYTALGLTGEAGEVADKIKKIIRDKNGAFTPEDVTEIKKELGDVLWYVAALSTEFGLSLGDIADANISKLQSRKARGKISGSGDDR